MNRRSSISVLLVGGVLLAAGLAVLSLARGRADEPLSAEASAPHPAPAGDAGPEVETAVFAVG